MSTRILTSEDVAALLPMKACIDVMARTLETAARGEAVNPLRTAVRVPSGSGILGLMPGYLGSPESLGIKIVTVMPGNHGTELDSHQGAVLLFDAANGRLQAVVDASSITAIRTAAVSAVATRALARFDSRTLAILGTGVQAGTHLEAMLAVREISEVRVWSRNEASAARFAKVGAARHGVELHAARNAREAVEGADVVCTTTSSREPVLAGEWLAAGAHVNAVGACLAGCRELDTAAVAGSRLWVDRRESAENESGDFLIPLAEGAIDDDHIVGEIGEVLLGTCPGRNAPDEITLFKSLGIAVEDLGAVRHVYESALAAGRGLEIEIGGRRADPA